MGQKNSFQGKRVLVTGGAGFIGSHLVEKLLQLDGEVIVLDDLSSGSRNTLEANKRHTFIDGDIRDLSLLKKIVKDIDIIFHLAEFIPNTKQSGPGHIVKFSSINPFLDLDVSVRGTLNVLEAARDEKIKVVYTSTAAVYGEPKDIPIKETTPPNPTSPYGASKLSAEHYCGVYEKIHQLPVTIARLFNVYGPRQKKYVMFDTLLKLENKPDSLVMLGSGKHQRDFIYVQDVVEGLIILGTNEEANGQIFNIGTGVGTSIENMVDSILAVLNVNPVVTYTGSSWKGDIDILVSDSNKFKRFGFSPTYDLEQGLKELISWYFNSKID